MRHFPAWLLLALPLGSATLARAEPARRPSAAPEEPHGRPHLRLDDLDVRASPLAVERADAIRKLLEQEARRADWGAGRGAHIEYRFRIDDLTAEESQGVLRVHCSATGFLPRGKTARSQLSFGGAPRDQDALIQRVLGIVTQGVVTRLADIERRRRGRR